MPNWRVGNIITITITQFVQHSFLKVALYVQTHCIAANTLHGASLHCIALYYNALHCIALHCTTLQSTALHYATLQRLKHYA